MASSSSSRTNKGKGPVTDAPHRSARSSNAAVQQAWEKVQYVKRNLEECDSLNRDEMRQSLIALKDEEFYRIVSLTTQHTKGDVFSSQPRSTFDRTISIMSLSPTCYKRKDPPSWVKRTNVIKTGVFVGGSSSYAEKSLVRMDMLMQASGYQSSDHPSVNLRPVGLGIFKGDGSNWVQPFRLHGHFSADSSWKSWTNHILQVGGAILKEAEIFDVVFAFQKTIVFSDKAYMAMLESILP
ncbi:hypothetical protein AAC387_Pa12g0378 [Persea americana]